MGRQVDMEGEPINSQFIMTGGADQSYPRFRDTQRMSFDYA